MPENLVIDPDDWLIPPDIDLGGPPHQPSPTGPRPASFPRPPCQSVQSAKPRTKGTAKKPALPVPPERQEFERLVAAANTGDQNAIAELEKALDARPEVWLQIGNLSQHAEHDLIGLVSGGNQLMRSSVGRYLNAMKRELFGPSSTLLERLAVQRVVVAWLHCQQVDRQVTSADMTGSPSVFLTRRQEAAESASRLPSSPAPARKVARSAGGQQGGSDSSKATEKAQATMGNNGNGAGPKAVNGHAARVQMTPAQAKRAEPAAKVNGAPKRPPTLFSTTGLQALSLRRSPKF